MARSPIPVVVFGPTGALVQGATVAVKKLGISTNATVYADASTSATVANPITTDAFGRAMGWVDRGAYSADISKSGLDPRTDYFDASPAGDTAIDAAWIGPLQVNKNKLAADASPNVQTFTGAAGTWNKPAGATLIFVTAIAGGNSGFGMSSAATVPGTNAPGGDGGGIVQAIFTAASVPASVSVTVGQGGPGVASTNSFATGGVSRFGSLLAASPGVAPTAGKGGTNYYGDGSATYGNSSTGAGGTSNYGIAGGAAGTSTVVGQTGTSVPANNPITGGGGGAGFINNSKTANRGGDGGTYGGGGGGALNSQVPGSGANGIVVVTSL